MNILIRQDSPGARLIGLAHERLSEVKEGFSVGLVLVEGLIRELGSPWDDACGLPGRSIRLVLHSGYIYAGSVRSLSVQQIPIVDLKRGTGQRGFFKP